MNPDLQARQETFDDVESLLETPVERDAAAERRLAESLDRIENLAEELLTAEPFPVDPLGYELPAGFRLSVVVPVFNEKQTIREIVARIAALPLPKEIVLVDDFSTDGTRELLKAFEGRDDVRVIYQPENRGKGAALRTGFEQARGDVIVIQDAYLEYDPRDIPQLVRPIVENQADVVYGSRFLEGAADDPSWLHRFGNGLLTWASNLTTGLRLTDMETCYKVFRREVIQGLPLRQNRFGFEPEVTAKLARRRLRMCELPIHYQPRHWDEGKKIGLKDAFNAFYCIARYAFRD